MVRVFKLIENNGFEYCFVYVGEILNQPYLYGASILYPKRTDMGTTFSLENFISENLIDVLMQAEEWIHRKLFIKYSIKFLREKS